MQPDPKLDYSEAKAITLAGVEYLVPPLAFRQIRRVFPGLMKLRPTLENFHGDFAVLGEETFDDLFAVILGALTRAYPDIKPDDLLDQRIAPAELLASVTVIATQTGLFTAAKVDDAPGETQGTTETASPISTS